MVRKCVLNAENLKALNFFIIIIVIRIAMVFIIAVKVAAQNIIVITIIARNKKVKGRKINMNISKSTITALSVLLSITVSNLEKITQNMSDREKSNIYDIFVANVMETRAVDTSQNEMFDYKYSRSRTLQEIMREARWR